MIFEKRRAKRQLINAFHSAEIYNKVKVNKNYVYHYPKIHNVEIRNDKTIYVFTLLNGMDPKVIKKRQYAFMQAFGRNIDIDGDLKKFTLTIYKQSIPSKVTYNYAAIQSIIENMKLPIVCGINAKGEYIAYDMVGENRASILIAGEPGAGKSTQLRQLLCTLIKTLPPAKLNLYLADLKRSEFHIFRNIEHVKAVCVTEKQLLPILEGLKREMQRRGDLLDMWELSHIDDLKEELPYIVVCIDEYSILKDNQDIEDIVAEIGSLGRALGVYLIISMQRPSHDLLPTKIRALLSTRMGFRVVDYTNAKLMGTPGSEQITIPGRMNCKIEKTEELQAPFLDLEKAKKILSKYKTYIDVEAEEVEEEQEQVYGVLPDGN